MTWTDGYIYGFVPISRPGGSAQSLASFDAATVAWVAAVVANGGTVSATEEGYVNTLIVGLKADGLFTKLDRLWLYALDSGSSNEPSALTDIIGLTLATNVNSTPLTVNGYTGNGSTMYIDTNFNPSLGGVNFVQDACSWVVWNNTTGTDGGAIFSTKTTDDTRLFPEFTDTKTYWDVNNQSIDVANSFVNVSPLGCFVGVRTGANATTLDQNGSQVASSADTSQALASETFTALRAAGGANFSSRQISCLGFGGTLTGTDRTNLYNRLRTYMTSVGVP